MLSAVKTLNFVHRFFAITCQTQSLKIIWKSSSESTILKTVYVHDHAHVHVDDHVFVIVVVNVDVIVDVDGFMSQLSHWNKVRHE